MSSDIKKSLEAELKEVFESELEQSFEKHKINVNEIIQKYQTEPVCSEMIEHLKSYFEVLKKVKNFKDKLQIILHITKQGILLF